MEERGMQGDPRYAQLMAMANQGKEGGHHEGGNPGMMPAPSGAGDGPESKYFFIREVKL